MFEWIRKSSGFSLVGVQIAAAITFVGFLAFQKSMARSKALNIKLQKQLAAEDYVVELLEYFRSLTRDQIDRIRTTSGFPLCSHINIINRNSDLTIPVIVNPHVLANLPINPLDAGPGPLVANRFYQLQIVDALTLRTEQAPCGSQTPYDFVANPQHAYLVTVGVSWIDGTDRSSPIERITLSTLVSEDTL